MLRASWMFLSKRNRRFLSKSHPAKTLYDSSSHNDRHPFNKIRLLLRTISLFLFSLSLSLPLHLVFTFQLNRLFHHLVERAPAFSIGSHISVNSKKFGTNRKLANSFQYSADIVLDMKTKTFNDEGKQML